MIFQGVVFLPLVLKSSTSRISLMRWGGERLRTLCTDLRRVDHTSSTKHMMILVVGRLLWTSCSAHLGQNISRAQKVCQQDPQGVRGRDSRNGVLSLSLSLRTRREMTVYKLRKEASQKPNLLVPFQTLELWENSCCKSSKKNPQGAIVCKYTYTQVIYQLSSYLPIYPSIRLSSISLFIYHLSWRKAWQPTPVFLPGEFHRQRSMAGLCP